METYVPAMANLVLTGAKRIMILQDDKEKMEFATPYALVTPPYDIISICCLKRLLKSSV